MLKYDLTANSFKLTRAPQKDSSIVIQKYLDGKSMNEIVHETKISKGKVYYLIKGWKQHKPTEYR